MTAAFTANGKTVSLAGPDADGITLDDDQITGVDDGAILGGDGTYTVDGTAVTLDENTSIKGGQGIYTADDAVDDMVTNPNLYQNEAEALDLKAALADGVLTAAELASIGADAITLTDEVLNGQDGVTIQLGTVANVKVVDDSDGDNTINVGNGSLVRISKDASGDKVLNAANATEGVILANNSTTADATLTGGRGNDSIIGNTGDVVNLSVGSDKVTLKGGYNTIQGGLSAGSTTEVTGFKGGFGTSADVADVGSPTSFTSTDDGKDIKLSNGGDLVIKGSGKAAASAAYSENTFTGSDISNASEAVYGFRGSDDTHYALVDSDTTYVLDSAWTSNAGANYFLGEGTNRSTPANNAGVSFENVTNGLTIDLDKTFYTDTPSFRNVQAIKGGSVNDDLLVGSNNGGNELIAGDAATTIIGGAGSDTFRGGNAGGTVFFHNDDQGKDTVASYGENDAIWTPWLSGLEIDGSDVNVYSATLDESGNAVRGENAITFTNAANGAGAINIIAGVGDDTVSMKVDAGADTTYKADVDFYGNLATSGNKMTVGSDVGDDEQNESLVINAGDVTKYWNIENIDASAYAGDLVLVGTLNDDTLVGGTGNNTLWGGVGEDLIQGGSGQNFVQYYMGFDGNDTITGLHSGDVLEMNYVDIEGFRVAIDDKSFEDCNESEFKLVMGNGDKLNVTGNLADVTFRIRVGDATADWKVNSTGGGFHLAGTSESSDDNE